MQDFARQFVASLAYQLLNPAGHKAARRSLIRQLLPYCVVRRYPGRDQFILLNREYKPLGWPPARRVRIDYAREVPEGLFDVKLSEVQLCVLQRAETESGEFWHLYGKQVPPPWEDREAAFNYLGRLRIMFGWSVVDQDGAR
jgi:hypothetical protein